MRALVLPLLLLVAIPSASAHEHRFLHIRTPTDRSHYADTADVLVKGSVLLPESEGEPKPLRVRVRLYRPEKGRLVVEREATAEVESPTRGKGFSRYPFLADIRPVPPLPPGQYVVRVDCFDQAAKDSPLLTTQSVFINIVKREPPNERPAPPPDEGLRPGEQDPVSAPPVPVEPNRFLRIFHPMDRERYLDTATIAVNGYVYLPGRGARPESLRVRVRLYHPADGKFVIEQEKTVKVRPAGDERGVSHFIADTDPKGVFPPGRYVVRVDCLDNAAEGRPILATQSVFLTVVKKDRSGLPLASRPAGAQTPGRF